MSRKNIGKEFHKSEGSKHDVGRLAFVSREHKEAREYDALAGIFPGETKGRAAYRDSDASSRDFAYANAGILTQPEFTRKTQNAKKEAAIMQ